MKTLIKILVITMLIACFTIVHAIPNADVSIFMRTPKTVNAGETYRVDITINKNGLKGFSKFETQIPAGFEITPINSNSSTFIINKSYAKFVWIEMPEDESLEISYDVRVPSYYSGDNKISGAFHYIYNNEKYSQKFCSVLNIYNSNPELIPLPPKSNEVLSNEALNESILSINENISFCVQLAAFSKKITPDILAELYEPSFRVKEVYENGLYKYYVGGFNTLQAARDFKEYCGVSDAFIIAYNRDRRTSIKDALLIIMNEK